MEFGWINLYNAIILVLMLLPNIYYAHKNPQAENRCGDTRMLRLEWVGRYGAMALMIFPLGVWKFGFSAAYFALAYFIGNALLLAAYYYFWVRYSREKTMGRAMALAMIPTGIFLLCGITLGHGLLIWAAVAFGIGHGFVTWINHLEFEEET